MQVQTKKVSFKVLKKINTFAEKKTLLKYYGTNSKCVCKCHVSEKGSAQIVQIVTELTDTILNFISFVCYLTIQF
jgi:hypothetical protein